MLPRLQLSLMFICQLIVIGIIFKGLFIDRIYSHKFFGFMDFLTELTIMFYLLIGMLNRFYGGENIDRMTFEKIQLYEIYMILATAGLSVVQVIYNAILSIVRALE